VNKHIKEELRKTGSKLNVKRNTMIIAEMIGNADGGREARWRKEKAKSLFYID